MTDIKLDIIIPAHKCYQTIGKTLKSLDIQTNKDFNLTIVLDGYDESLYWLCTANMPSIEGNIRILTPEHGGVASARNFGIENTCADYIIFLDADDILLANAVQTITQAAKEGFDYMIGKTMREAKNGNFEVVGSSQVTWVHGRTYSRKFLDYYGIRFPNLPMCEDLTFNMLCSEFAQKIPETQYPIHIQCYTEGSASRNANSEYRQAITYIQACIEYLKQAKKFKSAEDCMLLPAAIAACYWYLDGAETFFPDDNEILAFMSKQFIELLDEADFTNSERLKSVMPQALQIPVRPFSYIVPQTLTFEQRLTDALRRANRT